MQSTENRNNWIFETILAGRGISSVAEELQLTDTTIRRVFLRQCLKRAPQAYAEGIKVNKSAEPPVAWIIANASKFIRLESVSAEDLEIMQAIKLLESKGFTVQGQRPIQSSTPLARFSDITPAQVTTLGLQDINTLGDLVQLSEGQLAKVAINGRQHAHLNTLRELIKAD